MKFLGVALCMLLTLGWVVLSQNSNKTQMDRPVAPELAANHKPRTRHRKRKTNKAATTKTTKSDNRSQ
jgi:hypothetical protein